MTRDASSSSRRPRKIYPRVYKSDISLISIVRIARNLDGYPFPTAPQSNPTAIYKKVRTALENEMQDTPVKLNTSATSSMQTLFSRNLKTQRKNEKGTRGAFCFPELRTCVSVNVEDHLAFNCFSPGNNLCDAYTAASLFEKRMGQHLNYAWSADYGYLTASPDLLGTGMHASMMLHLIGLNLLDELQPVLQGLDAIRLVVHGVSNSGMPPAGQLVDIHNRITLGVTDIELIEHMTRIMNEVIQQEYNARMRLLRRYPRILIDCLARAVALIHSAHLMSATEALELLSPLRLASTLNLLDGITQSEIDSAITSQQIPPGEDARPRNERELNARDVADAERADALRATFKNVELNASAWRLLSYE